MQANILTNSQTNLETKHKLGSLLNTFRMIEQVSKSDHHSGEDKEAVQLHIQLTPIRHQ